MIFNKKPLIDAEWLLGPDEPQPRSFIRKDICAFILLMSIALVSGWTYLSDFVLTNNQAAIASIDESAPSISETATVAMSNSQRTTDIDESLIRVVDRYVPKTNNQMSMVDSSQPKIRNVSNSIKQTKLPISLPQTTLTSAIDTCFEIADLKADANPIVPLDLLSIRMLDSDETLSFESDSEITEGVYEDSAENRDAQLHSNRPTRVVRTVSYTGSLAQNNQLTVTPSEPAKLSGNVLRLPAGASSTDKTQDLRAESGNDCQLQGLDSMATGEVVRLLGSVQPRHAGAALNELKRRGFDEAHLQIAVDLASGRTEARIAALDRLISHPNSAPLRWLVWMAEDEDRKVREHAIRLLASIPGEDARTQMRLLMSREKDAALSDLLRKSALASGALLSSHEKKR